MVFAATHFDAIFDFDDVGVLHSLDDRRDVHGERLWREEDVFSQY